MTDPIDQLHIANEKLTRAVEQLTQRVNSQDDFIKAILETLKKSEDLFELRASRVLSNVFKGLTYQLDHTIEHAQEQLRLETQGFDIKVVNGVSVKENANTIIVVKTETGYDYSAASEPAVVINDNTQHFSAYFDKHPELFEGRTTIYVNISVFAPPVTEEV